ncbi:MAG: ATP-dependent DNA helicase [Eubacteriales bacterium]|nr:ATP-dependent DNA helicase [Eubacteriales bacterium]
MDEIKISVRTLVEFILRTGDIDNRYGQMADKEAMQMGSRLHRKIQGSMGPAYQAEVTLRDPWPCGSYQILVEGRADGIFTEENQTYIDEIKGVYRNLSYVEEPVPVHESQAKCYAYMYAKQKNLEEIGVQMTYCNLETEDIRRFRRLYTFQELTEWYTHLLTEYQKWCDFSQEWKETRQASIGAVVFPFPYREGQKDLAAAVYRTIQRQKKIFIQAPTGVGKTMSTVFPAVKAVGEGLGEKIFYLTAKTITRTVAWEAFQLLKEQGLHYKVITLTAKEKICPLEETDCNPLHCPYAKGHFDRVNDAVFEMLTQSSDFSRDVILAQAEKWNVCPFEMSLDASVWADAIICDYNYVFDPRARLKRFFSEGTKGAYLFLIDEAHNLVDRGREMFSAELYKEDFLALKKEMRQHSRKLTRSLEACNRQMLEWKRECEDCQLLDSLGAFPISLMNLAGQMEDFLEESQDPELRKKVLDLYFSVRSFQDIYDRVDENYRIYTKFAEDGRFYVRLYCINTAANLLECLDKGNSTVFFSATLLPVKYYMGLLCGQMDSYAIYAKSPFDREKKLVLVGTDVSSRYTRRGPKEYGKIAEYIRKVSGKKRGNYMVFCPSYRMLEDISGAFSEICPPETEMICQTSGMNEEEREAFLERFQQKPAESTAHTLVGFTVMGGIFGEGIDLKGESLIGAVIVGTGLPQVCSEREILKGFYDNRSQDGFSYAYTIPGMNKVLQSAGRVIRTAEDTGVILLLDDRFAQESYQRLFPLEWAGYRYCTLRNVEEQTALFWAEVEKSD